MRAQQYDEPWEAIVVDNGSSDGTCEVVRAYQPTMPHLRLIAADGVKTAGYARNAGAAATCGTRLLFCDADDFGVVIGRMCGSLRYLTFFP